MDGEPVMPWRVDTISDGDVGWTGGLLINENLSRSPLVMGDRQEAIGPCERLSRSPLVMGDEQVDDNALGSR